MNEMASVFLSVFSEESVAYWCFSNFMLQDTYSNSSISLNTTRIDDTHVLKTNVAHYFSEMGISKKQTHLKFLLSVTDPELFNKLFELRLESFTFCHEWLLLSFQRCFNTISEYQHCFEMLSSRFLELHNSALKNISVKYMYTFDLFICLSFLKQQRLNILNCQNDTDFYEIFADFKREKYFSKNFKQILNEAEEIFDKYCIITYTGSTSSGAVDGSKRNRQSTIGKLREFIFN